MNRWAHDNACQQDHWSERGRATSVANVDALGRQRRSVLSLDREHDSYCTNANSGPSCTVFDWRPFSMAFSRFYHGCGLIIRLAEPHDAEAIAATLRAA